MRDERKLGIEGGKRGLKIEVRERTYYTWIGFQRKVQHDERGKREKIRVCGEGGWEKAECSWGEGGRDTGKKDGEGSARLPAIYRRDVTDDRDGAA